MKDKSVSLTERAIFTSSHGIIKNSGYTVMDPVTSGEDAIKNLKKILPTDLICAGSNPGVRTDGMETCRQSCTGTREYSHAPQGMDGTFIPGSHPPTT